MCRNFTEIGYPKQAVLGIRVVKCFPILSVVLLVLLWVTMPEIKKTMAMVYMH